MKINAQQISEIIQNEIQDWHEKNKNRDDNYIIVTDEIRRIKPLNVYRAELEPVIRELVVTNTEMWHEEDKVRSKNDNVVLKAIRNINPLNQHRNDLIEEIDEIFINKIKEKEEC